VVADQHGGRGQLVGYSPVSLSCQTRASPNEGDPPRKFAGEIHQQRDAKAELHGMPGPPGGRKGEKVAHPDVPALRRCGNNSPVGAPIATHLVIGVQIRRRWLKEHFLAIMGAHFGDGAILAPEEDAEAVPDDLFKTAR
jgi:hypothetical protein